MTGFDSTADTLRHAARVAELLAPLAAEVVARGIAHDRSKTQDPELAVFNEFTPKLKDSTYGSEEYKGFLAGMGAGLAHHYSANRHHPEHFTDGVNSMTLVDLLEMLADWKAATERHADGDLAKSLKIQRERFNLSDQLVQILWNTAAFYGWLPRSADTPLCGVAGKAPDGTKFTCNRAPGPHEFHADGRYDGGQLEWADGEVEASIGGDWHLAGTLPARPRA